MSRLPLKYVHAFRDRHGHLRHYFRKGARRIPLPGLVGSEEFMTAYGTALTEGAPTTIGSDHTKPGTVGALVVRYYLSVEWKALKHNTQRGRRPHIERFREQHGGKQVTTLEQHHLEHLMSQVQHPVQRKRWLTTIRALLQSAVPTMRRYRRLQNPEDQRSPHLDGRGDCAISRPLAARQPATPRHGVCPRSRLSPW
jgi:hypothetical protein